MIAECINIKIRNVMQYIFKDLCSISFVGRFLHLWKFQFGHKMNTLSVFFYESGLTLIVKFTFAYFQNFFALSVSPN